MDRRQAKTRAAIFSAFEELLQKKNYSKITTQDIIDTANIGRSTFYTHFETKDDLLRKMCTEIFEHVFSEELSKENTHDFSGDNKSFRDKITHILYHIKDNGEQIKRILACESGEMFMGYLKEYLDQVFRAHIIIAGNSTPQEYILNHLVSSFAETIKWWLKDKNDYSPKEVADFYLFVQAVQMK